jgi:hypothetical protein
MQKITAILALALMFAAPMFAQQDTVSCKDQGIGGVEYTVCESGGRVRVVYNEPPQYWSAWFTHAQFNTWKTKLNAKHTNHKSEAEAQSWHTQDYCESDGFKWHDNGCHVK